MMKFLVLSFSNLLNKENSLFHFVIFSKLSAFFAIDSPFLFLLAYTYFSLRSQSSHPTTRNVALVNQLMEACVASLLSLVYINKNVQKVINQLFASIK